MEVITKLELLIASQITKDFTRLWSINELATSIKKKYRPVYAAVQRMIQKNILEKNNNNLVKPKFQNTHVFEAGEKKRILEIKNKDILIIQKKLSNMQSMFFTAVLFGSSVNRKGNDIDLLIILPDSEDIDCFQKKTQKALGSFFSLIDLNIITVKSCYEMLNKPNKVNVMNEIMKNHLVIYGFEAFYNIIKKWKND